MIDIIFFLIFAWILTMIDLDEAVLDMLKSIFNKEFSILYYYAIFAVMGLSTRLISLFQDIIHRD